LRGREYELDEMRTFIGSKKKKYWIVYAIDRATKVVVDFKVGKRNNITLKIVVDTLLLSKAKKIYTDGLKNYKTLIPEAIHKVGKYKINKTERNNLSVRTHLKRLSRKTICFSKSISMLEATLGVYFWKNSCSFV
jgi:insertion element IS1 protein InsB